MSRMMDALSWPGIELRGRGGRHDPRAARRVELAVGEAESVAREDAVGVVVDDGLVMQRVARRVHALEDAAGEREALARPA